MNELKISLAQWSLHREIFEGNLDNLEFAGTSKTEFGIDRVEYVNRFFRDKDTGYIKEMRKRADDAGVKGLLVMVDGEGMLGDPDLPERIKSVEQHCRWIEAAHILGCHSVRVNPDSVGSPEIQMDLVVDGLTRLTAHGADYGVHVIVENHGGLSSNGKWLSEVIQKVNDPGCGTLPDFGNFRISNTEYYDRYTGVKELMPYAKGVSAKSWDFDETGEETEIDFEKMLRIVYEAGYNGYIGIEYEGNRLSERDGIIATKKLLERTHKHIIGSAH